MPVVIDRPQRLMQLDVGTVRQARNDAGLDAVLEDGAVTALQGYRPPVGDEEHQWREHEHADSADPRHRIQGDVKRVGDDVVTGTERQHQVESDRHRSDAGTNRDVTRALQQVVVGVVPGETAFQERVRKQQEEDHAHQDRHPDRGRNGVVADVDVPRREQPDQTIGPHHVEVRLGTG